MAQGALLLSYHSTEFERHLNTFWLSVAIQSARKAGAHRHDQDLTLTVGQKNMRKRFWRCCLFRDNILALGVRRPLQIHPEQIDTNAVRLTRNNSSDEEVENSGVYDSRTQHLLQKLWDAQCQLVVELTDVMRILHPSDHSIPLNAAHKSDFNSVFSECSSYTSKLLIWFEKVQSWASELPVDTHPSVTLFTSLMYIYYQ